MANTCCVCIIARPDPRAFVPPCLRVGVHRSGELRPSLQRRGTALLRAEESQNKQHRGNQGTGAQTGAGELPHAEGGTAFRCEALFRLNGLVTAGQPAMGSGLEPVCLSGDLAVTACVVAPGRLPGEPIGDWTRKREPRICDLCPDTSAAPRFLWGGVPPGRWQFIAHRLIHMGGRHDSVVASIEETGSA